MVKTKTIYEVMTGINPENESSKLNGWVERAVFFAPCWLTLLTGLICWNVEWLAIGALLFVPCYWIYYMFIITEDKLGWIHIIFRVITFPVWIPVYLIIKLLGVLEIIRKDI